MPKIFADANENEIQRIIARGYNFECMQYLVLKIESVSKTKKFLKNLIASTSVGETSESAKELTWEAGKASIAFANQRFRELPDEFAEKPLAALDIGFTYLGLLALELDADITRIALPRLAPAFTQGAHSRSAKLGDTGDNSPLRWDGVFQKSNAHIVISIWADEADSISEQIDALQRLDGYEGLTGWAQRELEGRHLNSTQCPGSGKIQRKEHFGFVDGISQPVIRRLDNSKKRHSNIPYFMKYEAGEFLLGQPNEIGENRWTKDEIPEKAAMFFKNGSFAALRKMEQDVAAFDTYVASQVKEFDIDEKFLLAKLCGRFRDGKPLSTPPAPSSNYNYFDYNEDRDGAVCPVGSHVRRVNHRDDPDVVPSRRRPLLRRGIPYGPEYKDDPDAERGLLGLFICASLEQQFEFIMQDWVSGSPTRSSPANTKDPLIGSYDNEVGGYEFVDDGKKITLEKLGSFTRTRGMLYLFYPSRKALQMLANIDQPKIEDLGALKQYVYQVSEQKFMRAPETELNLVGDFQVEPVEEITITEEELNSKIKEISG